MPYSRQSLTDQPKVSVSFSSKTHKIAINPPTPSLPLPPFSNPLFARHNNALRIRVHRHLIIGVLTVSSPRRHRLTHIAASPLVAHEREPFDDSVEQVEDDRNDRIRSDPAVARVRQLQAQTSIDRSQNQKDTSPPEVNVAHDSTTSVPQKERVVQNTQSRLDSKQADDYGAERSVAVIKELKNGSANRYPDTFPTDPRH